METSANPVEIGETVQRRASFVSFAIDVPAPAAVAKKHERQSERRKLGYACPVSVEEMLRRPEGGSTAERVRLLFPEEVDEDSLPVASRSYCVNDGRAMEDVFGGMENGTKKRRRHRRRRSGSFTGGSWPRKRRLIGIHVPPPNVHSTDWKDMLSITEAKDAVKDLEGEIERKTSEPLREPIGSLQPTPLFNQMKFTDSNESLNRAHWITDTFTRRECARFVPTNRDPEKCGCGRVRSAHIDIPTLTSTLLQHKASTVSERRRTAGTDDEKSDGNGIKITVPKRESARRTGRSLSERWSLKKHTICLPTNAFGQIEFQGGPHPYKAQYVRMSFDTDPALIMSLFEHVWQIAPPKLIITVHGGTANFELQSKLSRVFRKGLLKAAMTTGAWIITSGVDTGVVRHVAAALEGAGSTRSKVVCIGISPWGLIKKRDELIGEDATVAYYPFSSKTRFTSLNNRHSYFLLVDNGSVGRYGAEVILRKRLETYIAQKQKIFNGARSVPVVSVVLEGGSCTIRSVLDYVTNIPRVPVVVCDGSGRAADLLAFAHQYVLDDGSLPEGVRPQLLHLVERTFGCGAPGADRMVAELVMCAQQKHLMTIFRLGEQGRHDVDHAILTALLKGQNLSPADQLSLALAWDRVDIARSDIFTSGQEWPQSALFNAMMEALIHDRVDFVRLLLENGVSMQKFLTIGRLEDLYNTDKGPPNTLYYIVRDVVKIKPGYRYKLHHIGMVVEKLMGNAYKSTYTSPEFRENYNTFMKMYRARSKVSKSALASAARSRGGSGIAMSRQSTDPTLLPSSMSYPAAMNEQHVSEPMVAAPSGNRQLSNHILWRSAYRRDNPINPLAMRPSKLNESKECYSEMEEELSLTGGSSEEMKELEFRYPFSELLLWAVLTKRQEMAMCMWQHGEEAMAKALIACRLYKSMATEAAEDYLEVEICDELKKYAEEFRVLAMELLEHCYHQDDTQTLQLLTYELSNWGSQTCLSLAVIVNNKQFLAHPCCQILLADLWHGGLRIRSHSNAKVICGLLFPPSIFMLEFKTREELLNQPQRAAEHEQDINDSSSSDSSSSSSDDSSSSSSSDDDDEGAETEKEATRRSRRASHGSVQSLNISSLFHSRRRRRKERQEARETDISCAENGKVEKGEYGTFRATSIARAPSPPSFVRKRLRHASYRQNGSKSDGSTKGSVYGSKADLSGRTGSDLAVTKESSLISKSGFFHGVGPTLPRMKPIKLRRRLYEFYAAPITTFWAWTLSFFLFLTCLTYVLLIRTPSQPTVVEWLLFAYVIAFGMEHTRKFLMSEMEPWDQKFKYFFFNFWNTITMIAVISFIIGFGMRTFGLVSAGRVVLACNSVLWTMKLLDFMSVHPRLGPYVTMAGKMIQNMAYIVVMLVVALLAFGLARQSITYPREEWHWMLVRNIFYKPYFMLYGEVYADEIDTCGDEAWDEHLEVGVPLSLSRNGTSGLSCVPGHWIPPILMTAFLLVANILLMSMLIAIFNHIFVETDRIAHQIWLFQRYRQVMEYESTPVLPPPFTPISHIGMLLKYVQWRLCKSHEAEHKRHVFDFSLKLFLEPDQVEKLHDFEEDCMDDLAREKSHIKHTSNEERIQRTAERTDLILSRLNDLASNDATTRETVTEVDTRLAAIEKTQEEILEYLRSLAILAQPKPSMSPAPPMTPLEVQTAEAPPSPAASVEHLAPLPIRPRLRTSTVCAATLSTDDALLSPNAGLSPWRFGSHLSLDHTPSKPSKRRQQRHEEYTSITDSIAFDPKVFGFKRPRSSEQPDSPEDTEGIGSGDDQVAGEPQLQRKKSSVAPTASERRREFSEEPSKTIVPAVDEEDLADGEESDIDAYVATEVEEMGEEVKQGASPNSFTFRAINEVEESDPLPSPCRVGHPSSPRS